MKIVRPDGSVFYQAEQYKLPLQDNLTSALIDDINAHLIDVLRVGAAIRRDIIKLLKELENELVGDINSKVGDNEFTMAKLRALLYETRRTIEAAYSDISGAHTGDLAKMAEASARHLIAAVNDSVGVDIFSAKFNKAEFQAMARKTLLAGRYADEWWSEQSKSLFGRFTIQMRLGMLQGDSIADLVRRVRGTRAAGFTDGLMNIPTHQAETLVRTSVIAISNAARLESYMSNKDIIKGVQWVSVLDDRTTEICMALDGLTWALPESGDIEDYGGYEPIDHDKNFPGPTAHFNCRSTQIAVLESFADLAKEKGIIGKKSTFEDAFRNRLLEQGYSEEEADKIEANTRASMDGQIGVADAFDTWLDKKSNTFQDDLLGKTAAQLWRQDKISLYDLTNQDNRPLSADELLAKFK